MNGQARRKFLGDMVRRLARLALLTSPALPGLTRTALADSALIWGVIPFLNTRSLMRQYQPLADLLAQGLGRRVEVQTAPDLPVFNQRSLAGDYDLLTTAAHFARIAELDAGYRPLLTFRNPIRCLLVTARSRPLIRLGDLKGGVVAVNEPMAIVPMVGVHWLRQSGLQAGLDYQLTAVKTQTSALLAAVSGQARAAIVSYSTYLQAAPDIQAQAQIFAELGDAPTLVLSTHSRMPPAQSRRVRELLLGYGETPAGRNFLDAFEYGGFRALVAEDFRRIDELLPETRRLMAATPAIGGPGGR